MAIDARIASVRHAPTKHILKLVPSGPGAIAGRRTLHITRNPNYEPHAGDLIWGNAHQCMIGQHDFRRIMQLWDGTEEVL
jgi:hypothetical protein